MAPDLRLLGEALLLRSRVQRRDDWNRDHLLEYQQRALGQLLRHAQSRSRYWAETLPAGPVTSLAGLPVLTKTTLMARWDEICTEPRLTRDQVIDRLARTQEDGIDPGHAWHGRWWAAATGGTTGRRAVLAWNRWEWAQILASYARVNDWADVRVDLRHPLRTAIVSSRNPTHQSAVVGASLRSSLVPTLRLDARASIDDLVRDLNGFRPRLLVAYASMVGPLAAAQREGRLCIAPERLVSASEVLPAAARSAAEEAWGKDIVVDSYAATETASIASTCAEGGRHLYEDFVIIESVDDDYAPVPAGTTGTRLLVTPLFASTLPLIRYELTDAVCLTDRTCPCGRPFALLDTVEGRTEDTLTMHGSAGPVTVHPLVFHTALEGAAPLGWQVEQQDDRALMIRIVSDGPVDGAIAGRVARALEQVGVPDATITVVNVLAVERTALGKRPLVKRRPVAE